jgi:hypothetical protein
MMCDGIGDMHMAIVIADSDWHRWVDNIGD